MRAWPTVIACVTILGACGPASATLVVQVRTDLAPAAEFTSVRVTLDGRTTSTETADARDWGMGVRVAELALTEGSYQLDVAAHDASGDVVVSRPVRVDLSGGVRVVTVLLTRDCRGVTCPGVADGRGSIACIAGRCVDEGCVEEAVDTCGTATCADPGECPAPPGRCATGECSASGFCFVNLDHGACPAGQVCDDVTGSCAPADVTLRPFGPARLVEGLGNGVMSVQDPTLSVDGLEIFYARTEGATASIWRATRRTRTSAWDPPVRVGELFVAGMTRSNPSLSRDGLTLYLANTSTIFSTTRSERGAPWGPTGVVPAMVSANCPCPSADHLALFACETVGGPPGTQIMTLTRSSEAELFGAPTTEPSLAGLAADTMPYARIPGGRVLYFASERAGEGRTLYRATRAGPGSPFETPVQLVELDEMDASEEDPWVSDDERWILFTSDSSGVKLIYEAFR